MTVSRAIVEPVGELLKQGEFFSSLWVRNRSNLTRISGSSAAESSTSSRSIGRGGTGFVGFPSKSNELVWHGHKKPFLSAERLIAQPRWGHSDVKRDDRLLASRRLADQPHRPHRLARVFHPGITPFLDNGE